MMACGKIIQVAKPFNNLFALEVACRQRKKAGVG